MLIGSVSRCRLVTYLLSVCLKCKLTDLVYHMAVFYKAHQTLLAIFQIVRTVLMATKELILLALTAVVIGINGFISDVPF